MGILKPNRGGVTTDPQLLSKIRTTGSYLPSGVVDGESIYNIEWCNSICKRLLLSAQYTAERSINK